MAEAEKFVVDGQEYTGINTAFAPLKEEWSEYRLEGGGSVRVQAVVTRVIWLTDESGNKDYHADGRPKLLVTRITNVNSGLKQERPID